MKNCAYPLVILGLLIALYMSVNRCQLNKTNTNATFTAINDTVQHFINKLNTQTASITTLQLERSQLEKMILSKDKELFTLSKPFSRVENIVKYTQVVKYDTIYISFKDSIPCKLKRLGKTQNQWYAFNYTFTNKGFSLDSLAIPNKATVITGFKRKWFLGKEILTTNVTNSNPHILVTNITAAQMVVPVPWYKKWYVGVAAGVMGGLFLSR